MRAVSQPPEAVITPTEAAAPTAAVTDPPPVAPEALHPEALELDSAPDVNSAETRDPRERAAERGARSH
jgi:hypothetical protein